jgi:hypothetical protein
MAQRTTETFKMTLASIGTVTLAALLAACGDSAQSGGGGSGDHGGGGSGASGLGGQGGGAELTCDSYCATVTQACVAGNLQYASLANCLAVCPSFPLGTLQDQIGDTLGCRIYQLGFTDLAADTKCAHGGPSGGDLHGGLGGICGDGCEAFCNLEAIACTGPDQQYATADECLAACGEFPGPSSSDDFDAGDSSGDTFNCRLYHLTAAATEPGTHCIHTKPMASGDPCSAL